SLLLVRAGHLGRVVDTPVGRHRLSWPERALLLRGVAAHREDEVEVRRAGLRELVPALAAQTSRRQAAPLHDLQGHRVDLALRPASRAERAKASVPPVVQERLRPDGAGDPAPPRPSAVLTQQRRTSATLQAWATHPLGVNGSSASKISLTDPMQ